MLYIVSLFFRSSDYPTFITNIECNHKNFLHILQCSYDLGQTECVEVVNIECVEQEGMCIHKPASSLLAEAILKYSSY